MGDMLTLIEQAEKTFDAEQSAKAAAKLTGQGGEFGLADFLQQMQMVRKMGPLSKIFGMLPGMGEMKDQINSIDEKDVDRIEAIIHSMTPAERDNPKIIDGSRRARIAKGSGTQVSDVNGLVNRFFEARKMMTAMASGKMPGMPGLPGMRRRAGGSRPRTRRRTPAASPATRPSATPRSDDRPAVDPAAAFGADPEHGSRRAAEGAWPSSSCPRTCAGGSAVAPSRPTRRQRTCSTRASRLAPAAVVVLPDGEHRDLWVVDGVVSHRARTGRRDRRRPGLDPARAWSTRTATSGWSRPAPCRTSGPRSTRWPTGTPGRCCCGTPAARPTPGGWTTGRTCPRSSAPVGTSPGRCATCATTPTRSSPNDAGRRGRAAGGPRRRLGQAGRGLDRPRRR